MKALILDHHFQQDIDALFRAAATDDIIRVVPAEFFASVARRVFPADVFDSDLARYHAADLARQRAVYREKMKRLTAELHLTFPFEVLVLPSDTFFYVRDVISAVREMGIPTVVVQKESGVSAKSLEHHATEMRRWFPFIGDVMTVCSEKSKEFWIACGARPDQVLVLGQPRFDVYCSGVNAADLGTLGVKVAPGRPVVLFLSYDLDAYAEERSLGSSHRPWEQLHNETERVLLDLAAQGTFTLAIKPHPQQNGTQLSDLQNRTRDVRNTFVLPAGVDTRSLLLSVDTVVGFQTTAIAEAMIAGKKVVYTFWTDAVERVKSLLLPFHDMGSVLDVATSPDDLRQVLCGQPSALSDEVRLERQQYCEPYLGIVDGRAALRVWEVVRGNAARFRVTQADNEGNREPFRYLHMEEIRADRRRLAWAILEKSMSILPVARGLTARARLRKDREAERVAECREPISGRYRRIAMLRGPRKDGMFRAAGQYASEVMRRRLQLDQLRSRAPQPR